jgi:hypothetical protein
MWGMGVREGESGWLKERNEKHATAQHSTAVISCLHDKRRKQQPTPQPANRRTRMMTKRKRTTTSKEQKNSVEPKIKWRKSKVKQLLHQDIKEGRVPLDPDGFNEHGDMMALKEVHASQPELAECDDKRFLRGCRPFAKQ